MGSFTVTISATNGGGTTTGTLTLTIGPPAPVVTSVQNAASFANGPLAPGSWAAVFGSNFAGQKVSVTFDGIGSTLAYTGAKQINLLIPAQLGTGVAGSLKTSTQMIVTVDSQSSTPTTVPLTAISPGIFNPGILNQDYSVNTGANPAGVGTAVQIYLTGLNIPNGWMVSVDIGNDLGLIPLYAGVAPGLVGLEQVNVVVPSDLGVSHVPVEVCVAQVSGNQKICSPTMDLAISSAASPAAHSFRKQRKQLRIDLRRSLPSRFAVPLKDLPPNMVRKYDPEAGKKP
jgi:uncharacterized protein (TIGR03437 family)